MAQQNTAGYGVGFAGEVVEAFGGRLVSLVESKLSALPEDYDAAMAKLDEVEGIIRSATKVPAWAQRKALQLLKKWASAVETASHRPLGERVRLFSTAMKFYEMASTATQQAYSAMEELSDQTVGLDAGSGEIYLDHYLTLASSLPLLSDALALKGDHDRSGVLKEVEWIQTALEDEGEDLIKAIDPELKRKRDNEREVNSAADRAVNSNDPNRILEGCVSFDEASTHRKLIMRMEKQVAQLEQIADRLKGPLEGIGKVLKDHAKRIRWRCALTWTLSGTFTSHTISGYAEHIIEYKGDAVRKYIQDCLDRNSGIERGDREALISFKRAMRPLFKKDHFRNLEWVQPAIEILARAERLSADSYDYRAKNTKEMQKAYLFDRMTPEQKDAYKELTSLESEPKGSKFAWLFLGLQALTMLRGAGSMLMGYDAAALASQAKQMRENLFNALDPNLKAEIEKDGAKMGTLLSDKWDQLKTMGEGSMQNGLLRILSPQAQEMVRGLVRGLEKAPTPEKIRAVQDALIMSRLVEHIPPVKDTSIGEWIELFTRAEEGAAAAQKKVSEAAGKLLLPNPEVASKRGELAAYLDKRGPNIDEGLLLHLGGREFGKGTGLEGYNAAEMLKYIHAQLKIKLSFMLNDRDREIFQKLSDKMEQALRLGRVFESYDLSAFKAALEADLDALAIGETLFWQGGWMDPEYAGGHSIVYEVLREGKDSFTFRIYNRGEGINHHSSGTDQHKQMILGLHEVVEIKRANLLRPAVLQGLIEVNDPRKLGKKWNPAEVYYNILVRMEGKISQRKFPIKEALPLIQVGICSFSSLSALFHEFLGSDRLYERFMIELEAKGAWDLWKQNQKSLGKQQRELLKRVARQTIQDAMAAARPERNLLSSEELDLIRGRMETILEAVRKAEHQNRAELAERSVNRVQVQACYSDLFFTSNPGSYSDLASMKDVPRAPTYDPLALPQIAEAPKMAKEVVKLLHQGNLDWKSEKVRLAAHEYVRGLPLNIGEQIGEKDALAFVDDLVQIAGEFQWALHEVFMADVGRTSRLTLKDAAVPIKLLTIADSIARKYQHSIGVALPDMLQHEMAIVLYGWSAFSRVDDPALEDDLAAMRSYWEKVDPKGVERHKNKDPHRYLDYEIEQPSLFAFEWAQAGYQTPHEYPHEVSLGEDLTEYWKLSSYSQNEWPFVKWTVDYLEKNPEKLNLLLKHHDFLNLASPRVQAFAALADEFIATGDAAMPAGGFFTNKAEVSRLAPVKGVLPEMFFRLRQLSFYTNYLFTGGWNSKDLERYNSKKMNEINSLTKDQRLRMPPALRLKRDRLHHMGSFFYVWKLTYKLHGAPAEDHAHGRSLHKIYLGKRMEKVQIIRPGRVLSEAYGGQKKNLLEFKKMKEANYKRLRPDPKGRPFDWKHEARELDQHLLGISGKADLQIEETLAYFTNNLMSLSQPEFRDLLNYMLFEQGILLEEIRKRTPGELSELVDAIAHLMKKGTHHFGEVLGNVEVQGYFFDLTAKCRRYLSHAGADRELIDRLPDPIPLLREQVAQSGLKPSQRTYLRYILAKHLGHDSPEDLAEIVTFAIQFDFNPLIVNDELFTAFDDEIRRDMLLSIRPKLHAALMGPERDRILNKILKGVRPEYPPKSWRAHGDFPLFQTLDGQITLDVLKGTYFEMGRTPRRLPIEVHDYLKHKELLSDEELQNIVAVQLDPTTYEFTLRDGSRMVFRITESSNWHSRSIVDERVVEKEGIHVKGAQIQRQIGDKMFQLQDKPLEVMFGNKALVYQNHIWSFSETSNMLLFNHYRPVEALVADAKTNEPRYRVAYNGKQATVYQIASGNVMVHVDDKGPFAFLTKMESPEWIRAWADPKSGKLQTIELPRCDLSFTVDEAGKVHCDQLPGYNLSPKQVHPYLGNIENYFVLDHVDRDQNTKQLIILPAEGKYYVYEVDEVKQKLKSRTTEGRLHLAAEHLLQRDYPLAAELLRGYGGQRSAYSPQELAILKLICEMDKQSKDYTPEARAVRMIAYAARIRNMRDFKAELTPINGYAIYKGYLHQLEYVPELALTSDEEKLIVDYTRYGFHQSEPILSMNSPSPFASKVTADMEKEFFEALKHSSPGKQTSLLRSDLDGEMFFKIYQGILDKQYSYCYRLLTGYRSEGTKSELLTALKMVVSSDSSKHARILSHVLAAMLVSDRPFPSAEEMMKGFKDAGTFPEKEKKEFRELLFKQFNLDAIDPQPPFRYSEAAPHFVDRESYLPREIAPMEPEQAYQHSLKLSHGLSLQGPVIEQFDDLIGSRAPTAEQLALASRVTLALEKNFSVQTGVPLADAQLAATVKGIRAFGNSDAAKPAPQHHIKDLSRLKALRKQLETNLIHMNGAESTFCTKLLSKNRANCPPEDPTVRAHYLAKIATGALLPIRLDDLALALIDRKGGVAKINALNPGLAAQKIDALLKETTDVLIHATERRRKKAVISAIKDLEQAVEKGASAQEISNLSAELKKQSEAVRCFNPDERPEYLVFEYYIGILLQEMQVEGLDNLIQRVRRGEKIHSRELSNVLEMIMGSGKTAVLTPLIAWLEANGVQISLVVMPDALIPEKSEELEQRYGGAFGRSIEVLAFDRESDFSIAGLGRLLDRLRSARELKKLTIISSASLQSLILRFAEDILHGAGETRVDLFRQVLQQLRLSGSIAFDELDSVADVLKLLIFSMEKPGGGSERQPANTELKEMTADLFKFLFTDKELSPIVSKPVPPEVHHHQIKPRLLAAILERRIGDEKSDLNRFLQKADRELIHDYLLDQDNPKASLYVDQLESMPIKNSLAVLKYQLNKMIPETFSRKAGEHYSLIDENGVDKETNLLSKPLEKGSWDKGSEHGTPEETLDYTLLLYLRNGVPDAFVRAEITELRARLVASLESLEKIEDSPDYEKLMEFTGGKAYRLDEIRDEEIKEMTARINREDPVQIINLAMKHAIHPQLMVFPIQLRADAQMLLQIAMVARGFSGTLWNWQTFDSRFSNIGLSDTEAKTLHLLQANSPQEVEIIEPSRDPFEQIFQGKPSVPIADIGNIFGDMKSEEVARNILEKGPWKGVPYYDEKNQLLVALRSRPSEPLASANVPKEDRAPYWKQELCTGSDIPIGTSAEAVVTFGRYTMMRDLLQTVWRLRKLDRGQTVRFAVAAPDAKVIADTLEELLKIKIAKLDLSHLLLYSAYIQAMRIGDDNHRSYGQQLRGELIAQIFDVIVQPDVTPAQVIEIMKATQDLFLSATDEHPYNCYGMRETLRPAKEVIEKELKEVLESKPMQALRQMPILKQTCDADKIEKLLRETAVAMLPRLPTLLASPTDTGIHLKVKTKARTKVKTQTDTKTKTKTQTQVQMNRQTRPRGYRHYAYHWTKELLFRPDLLKSASVEDLLSGKIGENELPGKHLIAAEALSSFFPVAAAFDPRLISSINRMPMYPRIYAYHPDTLKDMSPEAIDEANKKEKYIPYSQNEDIVTNHALLIEDQGEIRLMLLDQDDASDIQALLHDQTDGPRLALIDLATDKIWRQGSRPFTPEEVRQNGQIQSLKAQAKLVSGMLSYTEAEKKALLEFLDGKDVKAIRQWFGEVILAYRENSFKRFPTSDLERIFQKAMSK